MIDMVTIGVLALGCAAAAVAWRRTNRRLDAARAETEQLRAMVRKKVERPNVFSHEVRTPLTLIRGAAELLAEETPGPLTNRQREFVATISANAQHVISLAEDLLTEAKIDAQLFDLRLEQVDLRDLVRDTVRDARRLHHTSVRLDDADGPLSLLGDRALLTQALWNLVNNACRHAGPGSTVTVALASSEGEAILSVTDEGTGMSSAERDRLFEPFASAAPTGRDADIPGGSPAAPGGTGLGMTITERIIAQHGGRMLVDTVPGHGTTIFCTVPLAGPPGADTTAQIDAGGTR